MSEIDDQKVADLFKALAVEVRKARVAIEAGDALDAQRICDAMIETIKEYQ